MTARPSPREIRETLHPGDPLDERRKHDAIIEAARQLFTTVGYENTTMAEVARKASVAVGTVYLYFKNKSDLLEAVRVDWETQFLNYIALPEVQALSHRQRVRHMIEKSFEICDAHREMVQLMAVRPEQVGEWPGSDHGRIWQALQEVFEEWIRAGAFRDVDPRVAAVIAYGMVSQSLIQCFVMEGGADQERYIDALVDALEKWLIRQD